MNDKQKILKVAIDVPINQLFDYLPNDELFSIGQYVTIPFGRRKMIGVIYGISLDSDIHPSKLKSIINVDHEIIFDEAMFKLLTFVSKYYHYPIGQTIMSVVPSRLKKNLNMRPLLQNNFEKNINIIYNDRYDIYKSCAHFIIN